LPAQAGEDGAEEAAADAELAAAYEELGMARRGVGAAATDDGAAFYDSAAEAGGQQDSLGLPSEASLFQDLPDFLRDTTDD
jgi:hypothetical protein